MMYPRQNREDLALGYVRRRYPDAPPSVQLDLAQLVRSRGSVPGGTRADVLAGNYASVRNALAPTPTTATASWPSSVIAPQTPPPAQPQTVEPERLNAFNPSTYYSGGNPWTVAGPPPVQQDENALADQRRRYSGGGVGLPVNTNTPTPVAPNLSRMPGFGG